MARQLNLVIFLFINLHLKGECTLIFQGIKVALHWGIVVRISGFAHAQDHMGGLAEFRKEKSLVPKQISGILCLLSSYSKFTRPEY